MDLSELQDIDTREKEGSALHNVPAEFYPRLRALVKAKREAMDPSRIITIREYESIMMLANRIVSKRISKISYFASREMDAHNMTGEEMGLYATIAASAKELKELGCGEAAAGEHHMPEKAAAQAPSQPEPASQPDAEQKKGKVRRIRITKYVDAYRGLDNKEYGPFNIGVVLSEMPQDEAEWLMAEGYAEEA
jgi:DNA replication initiation complex subunit (GINS family)